MPLKRFYCPQLAQDAPEAVLSDNRPPAVWWLALDADQAQHARRVLRMRDGDEAEFFDGRGTLARGRLTTVGGRLGAAISQRLYEPAPRPRLEIAVALPKGGRVDDLVGQLTQLGADALIPLSTERSVVEPRPVKLHRLQRQVVEHARQCRRSHLLEVTDVQSFAQVLSRPCDLLLLADPQGQSGVAVIDQRLRDAAVIRVLIGPEGGFSDQELEGARVARALAWRMGPHVLRIETAAAAAVAILRHRCGDTA